MIREGIQSVQRNRGLFFLYISMLLVFHVARILANEFVTGLGWHENQPRNFSLYLMGADVLLALGYAFAQTIVFARIGEEIDRPYWKMQGNIDVLKRFFQLWLILNLAAISSYNFIIRIAATSDDNTTISLLFFWIILYGLMVPFGAAVMFYGCVRRAEMGQAINTLMTQLPRLVVALMLPYAVLCFGQALILGGTFPIWAFPVLTVIEGYTDCVVFSWVWLICMYHRDEEPEDEDFDF